MHVYAYMCIYTYILHTKPRICRWKINCSSFQVWFNTLNLIISSWIHFPENNVMSSFFMDEWNICVHVYHIYCISFICPSIYRHPGLITWLGCSERHCHTQLCTFIPAGVFMLPCFSGPNRSDRRALQLSEKTELQLCPFKSSTVQNRQESKLKAWQHLHGHFRDGKWVNGAEFSTHNQCWKMLATSSL